MSAQRCLSKAIRLMEADPHYQNLSAENNPCTCDRGHTTMTVRHFGQDVQTIRITCHRCKGRGVLSRSNVIFNLKYQYLWCRCSSDGTQYSAIASPDGPKVFGNVTYLCNGCGMVVQFR